MIDYGLDRRDRLDRWGGHLVPRSRSCSPSASH